MRQAKTTQIQQLTNLPGSANTPVSRDYFQNWNIRVVSRDDMPCVNYLSPNRRDFYKILFIRDGVGLFSIGENNYYIEEPTILFLHPNEIISWRNLSAEQSGGYYALFKKRYIDTHPVLKAAMEKHLVFADSNRSVIQLTKAAVSSVNSFFTQLYNESLTNGALAEDAMQAWLQLIIVESVKNAHFPSPNSVSDEFRHIHQFFRLLEEEASQINYDTPVRIKTAKEFADALAIHPNHLNALLKKHTGQNVSTHIKSRLLEESKALLLQTDWPLAAIGNCIGFADLPNFTQFFKKNTGTTPSEFRKSAPIFEIHK